MRGIISAFADQSIQNELKRDIENQDMAFMCDDCTNGVTLVMDVERHSDVDVIIMRYTAIKDIETYIAQIRAITKTARILLILSGLRKQYVQTQFDVYRKQYNVEDIIFEGKGRISFWKISQLSRSNSNRKQYCKIIYRRQAIYPKRTPVIKQHKSFYKRQTLCHFNTADKL